MKFVSERYPQLRVNLPAGGYVRFQEVPRSNPRRGELETTDKAAIDALKGLGDHYRVRSAGRAKDE